MRACARAQAGEGVPRLVVGGHLHRAGVGVRRGENVKAPPGVPGGALMKEVVNAAVLRLRPSSKTRVRALQDRPRGVEPASLSRAWRDLRRHRVPGVRPYGLSRPLSFLAADECC